MNQLFCNAMATKCMKLTHQNGKKAQMSMEYMGSYSIAALIIILVIAALGYYGVFTPDTYLSDKCDFGSSGIACEGYEINSVPNGNITLHLRNDLEKKIYDFTATIEDIDDIYGQGVERGDKARFSITYEFNTKTSGIYMSHVGTATLIATLGIDIYEPTGTTTNYSSVPVKSIEPGKMFTVSYPRPECSDDEDCGYGDAASYSCSGAYIVTTKTNKTCVAGSCANHGTWNEQSVTACPGGCSGGQCV